MNIQEQRQAILEGMAAEVPRPCDTCAADYPDIECDNAGPPQFDEFDQTECCALQWHVAEKQLAGLHDNGAVLKVEEDVMILENLMVRAMTNDGEYAVDYAGEHAASIAIDLQHAHYGRTAPLIEPEKPH